MQPRRCMSAMTGSEHTPLGKELRAKAGARSQLSALGRRPPAAARAAAAWRRQRRAGGCRGGSGQLPRRLRPARAQQH